MTAKDFDDRALPPGRIEAPAPSAELLNAVRRDEAGPHPHAVRGAAGGVALVGLIWPALVLAHHAYRPDLGALPLGG